MDDESECDDPEYGLHGVDYAETHVEYVDQHVVRLFRIPVRVVKHTQGDRVKQDDHKDEVFESSIGIRRRMGIT